MDSKILLVDDEKDIADLIEEVLRQDRFENIKKVYTGMDAVQVCREYQPDVVVLDIMLPDIDGIEVAGKYGSSRFALSCFFPQRMMILTKYLDCPAAVTIILQNPLAHGRLSIVSKRSSAASNTSLSCGQT